MIKTAFTEVIDIKLDGVGAIVADSQKDISVHDVGEGGGHGFTMGRFQ